MTDKLHENLSALAGDEMWRRGLKLFQEGAVLDMHRKYRSVEVRVANDHGSFERVRITFGKKHVAARCTCRQPRKVCEHAVAGLLKVNEQAPRYMAYLEKAEFHPDLYGDATSVDPDESETDARPEGADVGGPLTESLLEYLDRPRAEASLELIVEGAMPTMESRWSRIRLDARLHVGDQPYSASNMKRLVETGVAAGGMQLADFSPQEQQAMRFLVGHTEVVGSSFRANAHEVAELFHCLYGFPTFTSGKGRLHVHAERIELILLVKQGRSSAKVTPGMILPGRGVLPPAKVSYIAGRGGYWLGVGCEYWWLPGLVSPSWLRLFLKAEPLDIDADRLERLRTLCDAGRFPARLVPGEKAAELAVRPGSCRPVLTLNWQRQAIVGRLEFDYAGKRIGSDGPLILWGRRGFVSRDDAGEKAALLQLQRLGFSARVGDVYRLDRAEKMWHFLHGGLRELQEQWEIYWTPDFSARQVASSGLSLTVTAGAENRAWFETTCALRAGDLSPVDWKEVAAALRQGQSVISLEGGAVVQIPPELRQTLEQLLSRAVERQGDTFRFGIFAAVPLGDTLAPYWRGATANWQKLRERLINPGTLPPISLPEAMRARLRDYQREGIAWIKLLEDCGFHGVLADEMGLGKTIQALAVVVSRKRVDNVAKPSLVVCPTSLLENWLIEATRFAPELRTVVVRGSERRKILNEMSACDLAITSYALLRRDVELYQACDFDYIILDEAQHIKNPHTVNARTCKELRSDHRLILTGTPMENSLSEVWSLFDFLLPGLLGSHQQFRSRYESPPVAGGDNAATTAELAGLLRPFILRRTKAEVLRQLPPKMEQVIYFDLSDAQRELYDQLVQGARDMVRKARAEGWQTHRMQILSMLLRLRQLCCHPDLLPEEWRVGAPVDMPSAKTELVQEIILEAIDSGHRMLLFSQFTSLLHLIRPWLDEQGIRYEYLDGQTKNRQERVDTFNGDPDIPVFLLSLKAGGTGLNLTGADTVIHYDQWWNPMVEDQATDRTHRIGQERPVTSVKLTARHTIEENVLTLQASKRELFQQLLAGVPANLGELTPEDVEFLLDHVGAQAPEPVVEA